MAQSPFSREIEAPNTPRLPRIRQTSGPPHAATGHDGPPLPCPGDALLGRLLTRPIASGNQLIGLLEPVRCSGCTGTYPPITRKCMLNRRHVVCNN